MEKLPIHTGDTKDVPENTENAPRPHCKKGVFLRRLFLTLWLIVGFHMVVSIGGSPVARLRAFASCRHQKSHETSSDGGLAMSPHGSEHAPTGLADESTKVPFEAHIMSKCPDAQACIRELVIPTMEQVWDKVDFQLSFIASVAKESHEIECMHGPGECIGNMLMLCAANLPFPPTNDNSLLPQSYPRTPIIRSLGFANCLTTDYPRIPDREFVQQCALQHGIDFDALNSCASQQDDDAGLTPYEATPLSGLALLRQSALRGEALGVKTSCTVRVNETVWCVHDNNQWKDCAENGQNPKVLADEITRLWEESNQSL